MYIIRLIVIYAFAVVVLTGIWLDGIGESIGMENKQTKNEQGIYWEWGEIIKDNNKYGNVWKL